MAKYGSLWAENQLSGCGALALLLTGLLSTAVVAEDFVSGRIRNLLAEPQGPAGWAGAEPFDGSQWRLRLAPAPADGDWPDAALPEAEFGRASGDAFNLALDWGPLTAGAAYSDLGDDGLGLEDAWGLNAGYRFNGLGLSAGYGRQGVPGEPDALQAWSLTGRYRFGDSALHAIFSEQQDADSEHTSWALGLQHAFSERARVYSEYQQGDREADAQFGFGLRYDF